MIEKEASKRIKFHFLVNSFSFRQRKAFKHFIGLLFKSEKTSFESITIIFCSDQYLLSINNDFLHHDFYTDIITFNLAEKETDIKGEIYISIDRVKDNSKQLKEPLSKELNRVIFHGLLHLCGYKDKSRSDIKIMRSKEEFYLDNYSKYINVHVEQRGPC